VGWRHPGGRNCHAGQEKMFLRGAPIPTGSKCVSASAKGKKRISRVAKRGCEKEEKDGGEVSLLHFQFV